MSKRSPSLELGKENPPLSEAAAIEQIVLTIREQIERDYRQGVRPAWRDQHPKAHGCVMATFHIPKQVFDSPAQLEFAENLSFTPWHALECHRPLGTTNRIRRKVYETISKLRHEMNNAPRAEPTGDEVF